MDGRSNMDGFNAGDDVRSEGNDTLPRSLKRISRSETESASKRRSISDSLTTKRQGVNEERAAALEALNVQEKALAERVKATGEREKNRLNAAADHKKAAADWRKSAGDRAADRQKSAGDRAADRRKSAADRATDSQKAVAEREERADAKLFKYLTAYREATDEFTKDFFKTRMEKIQKELDEDIPKEYDDIQKSIQKEYDDIQKEYDDIQKSIQKEYDDIQKEYDDIRNSIQKESDDIRNDTKKELEAIAQDGKDCRATYSARCKEIDSNMVQVNAEEWTNFNKLKEETDVSTIQVQGDENSFFKKLTDEDPIKLEFEIGDPASDLGRKTKEYLSKKVDLESWKQHKNPRFNSLYESTNVKPFPGVGENYEVGFLHAYIEFFCMLVLSFFRGCVAFGYDVADNTIMKQIISDQEGASSLPYYTHVRSTKTPTRPDIVLFAGPFPIFRAELKAANTESDRKHAKEALRKKSTFLLSTHDRAPFVFGMIQCDGVGKIYMIYPKAEDGTKTVTLRKIMTYDFHKDTENRVKLLHVFIRMARVVRWLLPMAPTRLLEIDSEGGLPISRFRTSARVENPDEYTTVRVDRVEKRVCSRVKHMKTLYAKLSKLKAEHPDEYPESLAVPGSVKTISSSEVNLIFDEVHYQPRFPSNRDECVRVIVDVLAALLYLHKLGYVHRDVRRNNILQRVGANQKYILIDLEHAGLIGEVFPYHEIKMDKYDFPARIEDELENREEKPPPSDEEQWQPLDDIAQFGHYFSEAQRHGDTDQKHLPIFAKYLKEITNEKYEILRNTLEEDDGMNKLEEYIKSKLPQNREAPTGG